MSYTDNYDGTLTDDNTGLMWEIKDGGDGIEDLNNPHDVDNRYTWSLDYADTAPNGTVFTEFLAELNNNQFAGYDDWRLPTVKELQSLVDYSVPYQGPVVALDLPGETAQHSYWSSTSDTYDATFVWYVRFDYGLISNMKKNNLNAVRAVRGGL